jgi:hypothetical protein
MHDRNTRSLDVVCYPTTTSTGAKSTAVVLTWPGSAVAALTKPCRETYKRDEIPLLMCGRTNGKRKDENVLARTFLVFDIDLKREKDESLPAWRSRKGHARKAFERSLLRLKESNFSHAWHTTHSHIEEEESERWGWRVWIPLAEDVTDMAHWRQVNHAVNVKIFEGIVDDKCYNPERLMRLPAKHPDRPFLSGYHLGRFFVYEEGREMWDELTPVQRNKRRGEKLISSDLPKVYTKTTVADAFPLPDVVVNSLRLTCARMAQVTSKYAADTISALRSVSTAEALRPGGRDNGLIGLVGIFSQRFLQYETRPLLESLLLPVLQRTHEEAPDDPIKPAFPTPRALLEHMIDLVEGRRAQNLSTTGHSFVTEVESSFIRTWTKGARSSAMSEEELEALAQARNLTLEEFKRQLFITYRNDTYVWQVCGYGDRPLTQRELTIDTARAVLAALGISRRQFNAEKSEFVALTLEGILARYAVAATRVKASYLAKDHYYEGVSDSYVEAVGKRRKLEPKFHVDVHAWLDALGGERLLAWVASFTHLEKPTAILLLTGPKRAGKGLLANGLARVFEYGIPARAAQALSDEWTSALAHTPFIWGDEEVPKKGARSLGARLREIISAPNAPLRRKHLPDAEIEGYVRVMITANNANVLRDFSNDVPSEEDLAAIAERVLVVDAGLKARDLLDRLSKSGSLDEWRSGNAIAEHALWLAQNHEYKKGTRFLVEGDSDDALRTLLVSDGFTNQVLEWFVRFALRPSTSKVRAHPAELAAALRAGLFVRMDGEAVELYTTLDVILSTWNEFKPAYRMGSIEPFLTGLEAVCYKRRRVVERYGVRRDYWKVRTDYVDFFATRAGVSQVALRNAMLDRIDMDARFVDERSPDEPYDLSNEPSNVLHFPQVVKDAAPPAVPDTLHFPHVASAESSTTPLPARAPPHTTEENHGEF